MATMNKSTLFKDGDNLDLYLSTASEYTVDIEDLKRVLLFIVAIYNE